MSLYLMVQEANTVWHLFEKQFNDDLMPLTAQSPKHAEAVQQRKTIKVESIKIILIQAWELSRDVRSFRKKSRDIFRKIF